MALTVNGNHLITGPDALPHGGGIENDTINQGKTGTRLN